MLEEIVTNKIVLSVFFATAISQFLKTFNKFIEEKKFDLKLLWDTGGMPSSHSALASSLALSTLMVEGITTLSIVTTCICIVFIRDAFGLRRETGEQAKVINKIVADLKLERKLNVRKLKELVGHNFFQVVIGIFMGVVVTLIVFMMFETARYPNINGFTMLFGTAIFYALPGLVANMMPIFCKGRFKALAKPVDFGKKYKGRRIFGSHKTLRGFVVAVAGGVLVGFLQFLVKDVPAIQSISYVDYTLTSALVIGATFGFAALVGDAAESFMKRQLQIKPGKPFVPFDQIDYVFGIAVFSFLFKPITLNMFLALLIVGGICSIIATRMGYVLKIRKEKW